MPNEIGGQVGALVLDGYVRRDGITYYAIDTDQPTLVVFEEG